MTRRIRFGRNAARVLALFGLGSCATVEGQFFGLELPKITMTAQQQKFCNRLYAALDDASAFVGNDPSLREPRQKFEQKVWDDLYAIIGPSGEFNDWQGLVNLAGVGPLFWACHLEDSRHNFTAYLSTGGDLGPSLNTTIPASSPLWMALRSFNTSKPVNMSGVFIWAQQGMRSPNSPSPINPKFHFVPAQWSETLPRYTRPTLVVRFTSASQAR